MAKPDVWAIEALINLNDATTDMTIAPLVETIDIDVGDRDMEGVPNVAGGFLQKKSPQADTTITFEGYPVGIGDIDATTQDGIMSFFLGGSDTAAAFYTQVDTNRLNDKVFTVNIMWTDSTVTAATASIASGKYALRYTFNNCTLISCKPSMTDGVLKATWKFKCPAANKAGTGNIIIESTDGTASMPSI
jgi:hypothetical protein